MHGIINKLTFLDYAIVVAYVLVLIVIGYRASFVGRNKEESYFLANKSLGWASIGFNMWGTNVGPSLLLAFATIGYTTGIVGANFDWYAFVFLMLLAMVFAPLYHAAKVTTMPGFMGKRYGSSTQNILAWYALVKMLISWLSLGLFAGGLLVRQVLGFPMWQSVIVLVSFAGLFAFTGGLKAIAKVNIFQMLLLIGVSLTLTILGLIKVGGISAMYHSVPANYWTLIHPASDPKYPWYAILLGYPVSAIAFFCTDQAMVQSVLGAKNLEQGQLGISFIGWLKILSLPLFILTGILCYILYPHLKDPSEAYMTMVSNLFPPGMNGLVIVVLIAVLVGTIGSSLNALSTVFTMDIYVKKFKPDASIKQIIRVGRIMVVVGCLFAIAMALAIDSIRNLNLFDIFQSILGFIAPPLAVVFLLSVFWKRTTRRAVNFVLSGGSVLSLGTGVMYLWVFPSSVYKFWPHYLMLSFYVFVGLTVIAVLISLLDPDPQVYVEEMDSPKEAFVITNKVKLSWAMLTVVMIGLYWFFK